MAPWDRYLEYISKLISIPDEDKEPYKKDFDVIRDYIFKIMKLYDSDFRRICKGPSLFGSTAINARILKLTEFDVLMQLSFPFSKYIQIEEDEDRAGFINLNFSDVMDEVYERDDQNNYEFLEIFVDPDNHYLLRSKLQRWICNIIEGALNHFGSVIYGAWGTKFNLEYSKRGLAHTIYARGKRYNISIDFIPAIMFGPMEWMDIRNEHPFKFKCERWYAVPKPAPGPKATRRYAFLISNPKVENDLLLGRQHLKIVFRLIKSLCKKYEMKLKSYFITTAFLWEIENQDDDYWNNPVSELLTYMLGVLADYFIEGDLPFFWDEDLNLLDRFDEEEIESYADNLCKIYNTIKTYHHQPKLSLERCLTHFQIIGSPNTEIYDENRYMEIINHRSTKA